MKKPQKDWVKQTSRGRGDPFLMIRQVDGTLKIHVEIPLKKSSHDGEHIRNIR